MFSAAIKKQAAFEKEAHCIMLRWLWRLALALLAILAAVAWLDRSNTQEYVEIYSDDDEEENAF